MSYSENVTIREPSDLFGNNRVVIKDNVINLKSTYGLSDLRDRTTVAGSGAVANTVGDGEYSLSTGTTTASTAQLDSVERGRYIAGTQGQTGIAVRFPATAYTGTAYAEWGYFDDVNGFGFGIDATDIYIFTLRDSVQTKVYQSSWNHDTLDGSGASGLTLDLEDGHIFQVDYVWYGYGNIEFKVVMNNGTSQEVITVHKFNPSNSTSVKDPNLPLRVYVDNGNTTTDYVVYVGGRQYSVYTLFHPQYRVNSMYRLSHGSIGTTFLPTISFRKKTAYASVPVQLAGFDIKVSADMLYQVRVGGTLTGASYATPTDTTATETACEIDVTASAISGGDLIYQGIIASGGAGVNSTGFDVISALNIDLPSDLPISLCLRAFTSTATASSVLRWREEW